MRKVHVFAASDVPEMPTETPPLVAFESTCSVDVNVASLVALKATCTVHEVAAARVGDPEPQGLEPPFTFNANGEPVGASREIDETLTCAVPVFVFAMVTSNGAGVLPAVTLPKSKVAGRTCNEPAGGGGGAGAGVGAGLGLLPPPELQPVATKAAAVNNAAQKGKRCFMMSPTSTCSMEISFQTACNRRAQEPYQPQAQFTFEA